MRSNAGGPRRHARAGREPPPNLDAYRRIREESLTRSQVMEDPLEYDTGTHHTNMDTYERLVAADLQQAAVIVPTVLYNTATRSDLLPRGR